MIRNTLVTVLSEIVLPIAVYLVLVTAGLAPVWALVGSAAVSVLELGVRWLRTRVVSTLGVLVLIRFALGVAVAWATGDARFVLLKDYLVTLVIAVAAAVSLRLERPFIARIRRDLSPDPARFDARWAADPAFRRLHRRLTLLWVGGLLGEVVLATVLIYSTPLTVAVIATNVLTPTVLLTLIAVTQVRATRLPSPVEAPAPG